MDSVAYKRWGMRGGIIVLTFPHLKQTWVTLKKLMSSLLGKLHVHCTFNALMCYCSGGPAGAVDAQDAY